MDRWNAAGLGLIRRRLSRYRHGRPSIFLLHRSNRVHPAMRGHDPGGLGLLLRRLRRAGFRFASLTDLMAASEAGETLPGDVLAFTIDDGYRDQAAHLAPVFLEENVPVSIFLITGMLDGKLMPWDATVNEAFLTARGDRVELPYGRVSMSWDISTPTRRDYARRECLELCKRMSHEQLSKFVLGLQELEVDHAPSPFAPMSWDAARDLEAAGVAFGSHMVSHSIASSMRAEDVAAEISESRQRLEQELKAPLPILAWPIGKGSDYSSRDAGLARDHGIRATVSAKEGYASLETGTLLELDRFALPFGQSEAIRYATGAEALRRRIPIKSRTAGPLPAKLKPDLPLRETYAAWRRRLRARNQMRASARLAEAVRDDIEKRVDLSKVRRLLFACKGNVCRSPYAEAKAQSMGLTAASFGIHGIPDKPADARAVQAALLCGVDMSWHRSNSLDSIEATPFDLVLCMDPAVERVIRVEWPEAGNRTALMGVWAPDRPRLTVPDPFGCPLDVFLASFRLIDDCLGNLGARLSEATETDAAAENPE